MFKSSKVLNKNRTSSNQLAAGLKSSIVLQLETIYSIVVRDYHTFTKRTSVWVPVNPDVPTTDHFLCMAGNLQEEETLFIFIHKHITEILNINRKYN